MEQSTPQTATEALWQGQGNELVRSLQAAFAKALGQVRPTNPHAPGAVTAKLLQTGEPL